MHATAVFLVVTLGLQSSVASVYDRAITLFSPDGKLIQVSYAEEAVQRGGLAVAASNGRNAIAICLERPPDDAQAGPDHSNDGAPSEGTKHEDVLQQLESAADIEAGNEYTGGVGGKHRGRQRTRREASTVNEVVGSGILDDANNQDRKLCEVDEGVYLAFAGISADGRVLASKIRLECQSYRFGMGTPPGVGYIARYVGELQHKYTRTGGARPFGVSCVVAGFDEDACPRVFRSEPSGAFAEWTASAVGKGSDKALGKLEAVPELGALDWRGLAIEAIRATLASGGRECDVIVLRRETDPTTGDGQMVEVATDRRWRRRGNAWMRRFSGSLAADGGVLLEGSGGQGSKHECDDAEVL